jgi:hypothetical protein
MAFLDFLTGGGPLKRHSRRVANRDAQPEDRESSAHWLADNGTEEALVALCSRFEMQLEHSMKDRKEKELVLEMICEKGPEGARAARAFAAKTTAFAYAVRVVERVEGETAATEMLLDMLAKESVDNELKPEKKHLLLIALAERKDPRITTDAERFLEDFNEGVRHAAVEAIAAQDGDGGRDALLRALVNPKEESTRIRGRLAEIFQTRRWAVPEEDAWFASHVPSGFRLVGGRLVR